ncbi:MAG: ZIP family metal transporter [Henriciella sp.]|nr:ZIP family metal transporter [Henriciella sp.]
MLSSLQAPLYFGLIAAFVTTIGLLAVAFWEDWSRRYANLFGLAAAGMLGSMVFLHILPRALSLSQNASVWLTFGFFGGLLMNFLVRTWSPERPDQTAMSAAITPIIAIGIHSFIDGVIYAITFAASFSAGVFTAIGLILHEFPEGVIAFAILRRYSVSNKAAFFWAFVAAAATTPFGVLFAGPVMYGLGPDLIGALFAVSAGLLLYVATGPLLAPLAETPPTRGLLALSSGIAVAFALIFLPIGLHDHDHDHSGHDHHEHSPPDLRNR